MSDRKIIQVLHKVGFSNATKIADTLQGSIWRACNSNGSSVIKVTNIFLHTNKIAIVNGETFKVKEDILMEQAILKYVTGFDNCPNSIVKHQRFFKTTTDYFLVMEDGGSCLFDFIQSIHGYIRNGRIDISEWIRVCKIIFQQMLECMAFLHEKNVCHFDFSLENFLINDVEIAVRREGNSEKISILTDDIQIKICDFGLAKLFTKKKALSNRWVGKATYKSPENVNKNKRFDAKKNDIWCLGICLFMIVSGVSPWARAEASDAAFMYVMSGRLSALLSLWGLSNYFDHDLVDLFECVFQYESERFDLNQIKKHRWVSL